MQATSIKWCDFSSNPIKYRDKRTGRTVWACVKHSPGCANCYAESLALRYKKGSRFGKAEMENIEPFLDENELKILRTDKKLKGKRVFIGDMTDIIGDWVPFAMLDRLFAVMALRDDVTFQLLTKRVERLAEYMSDIYRRGSIADAAVTHQKEYIWTNTVGYNKEPNEIAGPMWPLPNVHLGFSAENQECFDKRAVQAAQLMRDGWMVWTSAEPLLSEIKMQGWDGKLQRNWLADDSIGWIVVGGESGSNRRPMELDWLTGIVEQCKTASVPVFVKQDTAFAPGQQGRIPLETWNVKEFPEPIGAA